MSGRDVCDCHHSAGIECLRVAIDDHSHGADAEERDNVSDIS